MQNTVQNTNLDYGEMYVLWWNANVNQVMYIEQNKLMA